MCFWLMYCCNGESCIQTCSKYCAIEKYGILKTNGIALLRNKRENKYKNRRIPFEFCSCRFLLIKA